MGHPSPSRHKDFLVNSNAAPQSQNRQRSARQGRHLSDWGTQAEADTIRALAPMARGRWAWIGITLGVLGSVRYRYVLPVRVSSLTRRADINACKRPALLHAQRNCPCALNVRRPNPGLSQSGQSGIYRARRPWSSGPWCTPTSMDRQGRYDTVPWGQRVERGPTSEYSEPMPLYIKDCRRQ